MTSEMCHIRFAATSIKILSLLSDKIMKIPQQLQNLTSSFIQSKNNSINRALCYFLLDFPLYVTDNYWYEQTIPSPYLQRLKNLTLTYSCSQ